MELILLLNNLSSGALVVACLWLTHTYRIAGHPHGLSISVGFAVLGMTVLLTAFARNLYIDPNPLIVVTKIVLVFICVMLGRRVSLRLKHS